MYPQHKCAGQGALGPSKAKSDAEREVLSTNIGMLHPKFNGVYRLPGLDKAGFSCVVGRRLPRCIISHELRARLLLEGNPLKLSVVSSLIDAVPRRC